VFLGFHRSIPFLVSLRTFFYFDSLLFFGMITLGFPQSTLATHTEARAVKQIPLKPGDNMTIDGQYPPCPSCQGKMRKTAEGSGATINYNWPENGVIKTKSWPKK
ncbi:hypothetical protein, partial [Hydromonas duriensis]|uniref:hypothetical protein n=1 Tax=Hydromonas duriensis TaxID=1527608 RepID=UPI001B85B625